jgi:hypothetical protein
MTNEDKIKEILGDDAAYMLAQFIRVDENVMSAKVEINNASPMMLLNIATSIIEEISDKTEDSVEDVVEKVMERIGNQQKTIDD